MVNRNAFVLGGCLPTARTPPAAEMSPIPAEVTQVAPATPTVEVTKTPPPGFQTETPVAPVDIKAGHPDYHDASVGGDRLRTGRLKRKFPTNRIH